MNFSLGLGGYRAGLCPEGVASIKSCKSVEVTCVENFAKSRACDVWLSVSF
jgi:hypothetical protein